MLDEIRQGDIPSDNLKKSVHRHIASSSSSRILEKEVDSSDSCCFPCHYFWCIIGTLSGVVSSTGQVLLQEHLSCPLMSFWKPVFNLGLILSAFFFLALYLFMKASNKSSQQSCCPCVSSIMYIVGLVLLLGDIAAMTVHQPITGMILLSCAVGLFLTYSVVQCIPAEDNATDSPVLTVD